MRVCLIGNQIAAWGKIGGFGTNTRRLGRSLAAKGVDVHVVIPRRRGQRAVETLDGMTVHGQSNLEVFFDQDVYRRINADIYHAQEPTISAYRAQQAMPHRFHLVTSMDPRLPADWWIEFVNATWVRRLKYPLQHIYENGRQVHQAVRNAHGVYVEAEFLKPKAARLYRLDSPPGLLPKPVDIPEGPFEKSSRPLCAFVGRFDPRKRPERFFQLAARMPDVRFIAVGRAHDASYQKYLERRYFHLENLEVTGLVDPFRDDTLGSLLSQAWVLVHPAAREGLPTAFQEASGHEVAILAYVDPGDYVSRFGAVVPDDGHIESLHNCLRNLLESGRWREAGIAGRQWNLDHHSIPVSIAAHMHIYRESLGLKHPDTEVGTRCRNVPQEEWTRDQLARKSA